MPRIAPQPGIMDIALYVGGQSRVEGVDDVVKLSSNENPFGPSPAAIEAIAASAGQAHRYPSTDHAELRAAIGAVHGLDETLGDVSGLSYALALCAAQHGRDACGAAKAEGRRGRIEAEMPPSPSRSDTVRWTQVLGPARDAATRRRCARWRWRARWSRRWGPLWGAPRPCTPSQFRRCGSVCSGFPVPGRRATSATAPRARPAPNSRRELRARTRQSLSRPLLSQATTSSGSTMVHVKTQPPRAGWS